MRKLVPGASIPHTADGGISVRVMATGNTCTGGQACYQLEEDILDSVITLLTAPRTPTLAPPRAVKSFDPTSEQPCQTFPALTSCLRLDRWTLRPRGDIVNSEFVFWYRTDARFFWGRGLAAPIRVMKRTCQGRSQRHESQIKYSYKSN